MTDIQHRVQTVIDDLVGTTAERGLQVSVYHHGEVVVDAVAGVADPTTGTPVTPETLFYAYSTGKTMTSTAAHVLIERGELTYDTRIADVWPEFAAHGKQDATIRHLLTHTVGVPGLPSDTSIEQVCDWDTICARIADSELWWKPGTKTGYHAYTYGFIVGEVVHRVTGRRISEVLRDDIAQPLGATDELFFGVPETHLDRVARLEDAEGSAEFLASLPDDSPFFAVAPRALTPTAEFGNRRDILAADIPAGGKLTARAVAKLYAALLGDVPGVRLISPDRLADISDEAFSGTDQVFGMPTRLSLGFGLGVAGGENDAYPTTFGWGGVGGSMAFADPATGVAFAVTKNHLSPDFAVAEQLARIVLDDCAGS